MSERPERSRRVEGFSFRVLMAALTILSTLSALSVVEGSKGRRNVRAFSWI
jgi:hypothetical protein